MAKEYKPHLYKAVEWQMDGMWYCADTSDLVHDSSAWHIPCRILGISPAEFVRQLKEIYHCDDITWYPNSSNGRGLLLYCWTKQADMRKFKNYLNKIARDKNFFI